MWVNQINPFFNVAIQGPHRMASAIRNHPVAVISSAVTTLTLPTLLLWLAQGDEEWYKDLSPMERYRYWHVKIPGTDTILRIPKPFEWGHIFSSMPEAALQSMVDEDPEALTEAAGAMLEDMTPSIIPGLLEAPIEIAANKDFYFDRPLIPRRLQALETKDQYNPYTTATAKAIGKLFGVSPIYVEHLAGGWTGGLATGAISAVKSAAGLSGKKTQREITGGPSTLPVVGRLFLPSLHTRQFNDFYNRLEKLEQKHASLKLKDESAPSLVMLKFMQARSRELAELRKESRSVLADDKLSDEQKREHFTDVHLQMTQMAREANLLAHRKRPTTDAGIRKQWKEIHKTESGKIIYNAAKPPPSPRNYRGRPSDLEKAQLEYRDSRELEKHRAHAVAPTLDIATQELRGYWTKPDSNGKKGKLTHAYWARLKALKQLYSQD